jgi:sirohydrochlorin ferrochelatase
MKALLVTAHGSRQDSSNEEVRALSRKVLLNHEHRFQFVGTAFLEIANPSIFEAVAELVGYGALEIVLFPFFISGGSHVTQDLPRIISELRLAYPQLNFKLLPHLGAMQGIESLIIKNLMED